jgi:uncharacterized membrane protein YhaH (DUF805 family)
MTFLFVGSVIVALSFVRAVAQGLHLPLIDLLINGLIGVFVGVVVISAGFQRMHDRGRSGWWLLVFFGPTTLVLFAMGRLIDMRAPENAITLTFLIGMTFAAPTFIWGICETVLLPPKPSAPKTRSASKRMCTVRVSSRETAMGRRRSARRQVPSWVASRPPDNSDA